MTSYQKRLQEIAYLKERVAQLEALLPPETVRQLDQDYINKRRSAALANIVPFDNTVVVDDEKITVYDWQGKMFKQIWNRVKKHLGN